MSGQTYESAIAENNCSADVPVVVTTILATLSTQTTTEQLCAKPTDLVVKGQESAPHYRLWKWESNCKVNSAGELVLLKCTGRV